MFGLCTLRGVRQVLGGSTGGRWTPPPGQRPLARSGARCPAGRARRPPCRPAPTGQRGRAAPRGGTGGVLLGRGFLQAGGRPGRGRRRGPVQRHEGLHPGTEVLPPSPKRTAEGSGNSRWMLSMEAVTALKAWTRGTPEGPQPQRRGRCAPGEPRVWAPLTPGPGPVHAHGSLEGCGGLQAGVETARENRLARRRRPPQPVHGL